MMTTLYLLILVGIYLHGICLAAPVPKQAVNNKAIEEFGDGTLTLEDDSIVVGDRLFKTLNSGKDLSYDQVESYIDRFVQGNATATLAMLKSKEENDAVSNYLLGKGIQSAMIGLKQQQTLWKWIADDKLLRKHGFYPLPWQLYNDHLNLSCSKDCVSACSYNKKKYAYYQEQSCTLVGCTSTNKYGVYSTAPDGYEHWADGNPVLARSCAAISRIDSNFWVDRSCSEIGSFICEIPATGIQATHKKACFPEEGKCFVLFMEPLDFMGAQRFCEGEGGHMAALNGPTEQLEAERLLLTNAPELTTSNAFNLSLVYTWIGAKNHDYVWPNGDTPNKHRFKNWAPNEPKTSLDCVVMDNQLSGFAKFPWKSEQCDKSRTFLLSAERFTVTLTSSTTSSTTTKTSTTQANVTNQAMLYTRPPGAITSPVGVTPETFNTVWAVLLGVIALLLIIIILLVCGCIPGRKSKVQQTPKIDQECQTKAIAVRHVPSQSTPTIVSKGMQVEFGPSQSDEDTMKRITILIEQFFKEQVDKNSELQVNFGVLQQRIDLLTELVKQCKEEKERIEREMMRSSREQEVIVRHDNKEYVEKVSGKVININLQCDQPSSEHGNQAVSEDTKKCAEMEETLTRVYEQQRLLIETLANTERQEPEPLPPYIIYPPATKPSRKKKNGRRKKKKRQTSTISVFDRLHIRQPPCGKKLRIPGKYYLWQSTKQIHDSEHPVRITLSPRSLVATSPHRVKLHRSHKPAKTYRTTTTTTTTATKHSSSDDKKKFQRKQKTEKPTAAVTSDIESSADV